MKQTKLKYTQWGVEMNISGAWGVLTCYIKYVVQIVSAKQKPKPQVNIRVREREEWDNLGQQGITKSIRGSVDINCPFNSTQTSWNPILIHIMF